MTRFTFDLTRGGTPLRRNAELLPLAPTAALDKIRPHSLALKFNAG